MKLTVIGPLIFVLLLSLAVADEEKLFKGGVGIGVNGIVIPTRRWLVVEKRGGKWTVRFSGSQVENQMGYELYEFRGGEWRKIKDGVVILPVPEKGLFADLKGLFLHSPTGDVIKFGSFSLFSVPKGENHGVLCFLSPIKLDPEVRLAPTPWKEISEVNLSDPRIRWYTYDEKREWKVIPIDKIWD
jgi:hypothetical protein